MAFANVLRERANVGHERQVGDVLMNRRTSTGRPGFLGDGLDALAIAPHEGNLDTISRELDRRCVADSASGPGEQDEGHAMDSTCSARGTASQLTRLTATRPPLTSGPLATQQRGAQTCSPTQVLAVSRSVASMTPERFLCERS